MPVHACLVTIVKRTEVDGHSWVGSALAGYLTDDPGVLKSQLVPALVSTAYTAVARDHFGFEQDLPCCRVGGDVPQSGDPFGWFHVENACVIEAGGREYGRIVH